MNPKLMVLQIGIGPNQGIRTQHFAHSFGLPDHFQGDQLIHAHSHQLLQRLAQLLRVIGGLEKQLVTAGHQQGDGDEIAPGVAVT